MTARTPRAISNDAFHQIKEDYPERSFAKALSEVYKDPDGAAWKGSIRDFSPENGGYTSPVFEIMIAGDTNV